MQFDHFLQYVPQLKSKALGGLEAQFKLAPAMRKPYTEEKIKALQPKRAAVVSLCYPNSQGETLVLLTKRASYNGKHSDQISFPGGKIEQQDTSLTDTALRETYEEVGVHSKDISIIRELTDVFIPPSNFLATPFLAMSPQRPNFTTNHEVAALIEVRLQDILDDTNIVTTTMTTSYMDTIEIPCFKINNEIIWGATGMMLSELKELFIQ